MDQNIDFINSIQEDTIRKEIICNRLSDLNKCLHINKDLIMYVNIRSLNANHTKLQVLIENLEVKPCLIVCSETRILEYYKYYPLSGYKIFYNNSKINNCDGVVIYIKDNIAESTETIEVGRPSILNSSISIENNIKLVISALYRSHDLHKPEFIIELKFFLDITKKIKNHLIIGDFNIDIMKLDNNSQEFLNNFLESITRPSDNNIAEGTCIDNIFIKTNLIETETLKLEDLFTDHYPLFLTISKKRQMDSKNPYYSLNYNKMKRIAAKESWISILSIQDPNLAIESLISIIKNCTDLSKNCKKKQSKSYPRSNWITREILESCDKKESLYKKWKMYPNNEIIRTEYKNYLKVHDKIIIDAKCKYDREQIMNKYR